MQFKLPRNRQVAPDFEKKAADVEQQYPDISAAILALRRACLPLTDIHVRPPNVFVVIDGLGQVGIHSNPRKLFCTRASAARRWEDVEPSVIYTMRAAGFRQVPWGHKDLFPPPARR